VQANATAVAIINLDINLDIGRLPVKAQKALPGVYDRRRDTGVIAA
jgi:hypothetical protein